MSATIARRGMAKNGAPSATVRHGAGLPQIAPVNLHKAMIMHTRVGMHRIWSSTETSPRQPGKIRQFLKKYGKVGLGVYLGLSVVDLGATMAVISVMGATRVRQAEDWALAKAKACIGLPHEPAALTQDKPSWASLFFIAYGIHKTLLLPLRLSLTAAITPALAKKLRSLGWIKPHPPQ